MPTLYLQVRSGSIDVWETISTEEHDGTENSMLDAYMVLQQKRTDWQFNHHNFFGAIFRTVSDVKLVAERTEVPLNIKPPWAADEPDPVPDTRI